MTARTRLRSIGACALLVLAAAGILAPPASAHPPTVSIRPFADRQTSDGFRIEATVRHDSGAITGPIALTILSRDGQPQVAAPPTQGGNGGPEQTVSFDVGGIEYNGPYQARVTAKASRSSVLGIDREDHGPQEGAGTRDFLVLVPPRPPAQVQAAIDADSRMVTVTWKPNPEKDIVGYIVQRNGADAVAVREPSFTDASTANAGGTYTYKVQAVRPGATPSQGLTSDPVTVTANVPNPPGPATTVAGDTASTVPGGGAGDAGAAGAGGTGGSTTGTTLSPNSPGALKKSGTIDLSGFSSIQSQARRPATRAPEVDPGFTNTLPFDTTDTTRLVGDEQAGAAEADSAAGSGARELGAQDASNDRQRSAGFLAAGLLATVLLMHLLWIKGEVEREPLEVLAPE